jgi:AraC-like DNA-binding protein
MNRLLGKKLGMSRTHFYRKLKAIIDQHPTEFIQTFRLKKAVLLLKNNYGNISEVAFSIGFNSLTYFTRLFKKQYGMTPSDYIQHCSENKFSTQFKHQNYEKGND